MPKGENHGSKNAPGFQPTDRTKDKGKEPPVVEPLSGRKSKPLPTAESIAYDAVWETYRENLEAANKPDVEPVPVDRNARRMYPPFKSEGSPTCPNGCDLQGPPIPQESIDKGYYGKDATHFSRIIGIEIRGVYDGVAYWECPDCDVRWHRWSPGSGYYERIESWVESQRPAGFTVAAS